MNDDKPGWQTTEWWTTLGGQVASLVVALVSLAGGTADAQHSLGEAAAHATVGVGAVVVFGLLGWKYIHSRTQLKLGANLKR